MSSPYVGEVRLFGGNFAPAGWAFCQGQLLAISENPVLFQLIGTTYGGDGQVSYALPDLRGRVPLHQGQGQTVHVIGELGGAENVTLTTGQMPGHSHALGADTAASSITTPAGALLASTTVNSYDNSAAGTLMSASAIGSAGGSLPHDNMAPTVVLNYIIALFGVFPSQA